MEGGKEFVVAGEGCAEGLKGCGVARLQGYRVVFHLALLSKADRDKTRSAFGRFKMGEKFGHITGNSYFCQKYRPRREAAYPQLYGGGKMFEAKLPHVDLFHILKSLAYFGDAEADGDAKMLQKVTWATLKKTITKKTQAYLSNR